MVKTFVVAFILVISCGNGLAQNKQTDSLLRQLSIVKNDSGRVWVLAELCSYYRYSNPDSSIFYGHRALNLARRIMFLRGEANILNRLSITFREIGDLPKSLELQYIALKISEDNNYQLEKSACLRRIASVYAELKNYNKAIGLYLTALAIDSVIKNKAGEAIGYANLGMVYQYMNNVDSALYYNGKAFRELNYYEPMAPEIYRVRGDIEAMKGYQNTAVNFYQQGIRIALKNNDYRNSSFIYSNLAALYKQMNHPDSSIYYALKGVESGQKSSFKKGILLSANLLAQLYDSVNPQKSLHYYKIAATVKDSLFGAGNIQTIQSLITKDEERRKEIELAKSAYHNKLKQYGLSGGLGVLCIIAFIFYRNNRQKQKANQVLQATLDHLKSTQAQLIQSEKMASLGELTAGIAHEIQNPLNFVNNFSDLNKELVDELQQELKAGNTDDAIAISNDIKENEEKINHHGKRADAIVKGMLQHSQISTGKKEPTDINKLADEYLRLAYHGIRAKDKSFNATLKIDFDETIGNINIIPQDIGRVILNLITNAFYAVNERSKVEGVRQKEENAYNPNPSTLNFTPFYEPTVTVKTSRNPPLGGRGAEVLISVKDNGNGIPQKIQDKIFQPFFTTKPTGQGTGLGLSLSYDIVKAHGGEIKVVTKVDEGNPDHFGKGEGTEFIIVLPVN